MTEGGKGRVRKKLSSSLKNSGLNHHHYRNLDMAVGYEVEAGLVIIHQRVIAGQELRMTHDVAGQASRSSESG